MKIPKINYPTHKKCSQNFIYLSKGYHSLVPGLISIFRDYMCMTRKGEVPKLE